MTVYAITFQQRVDNFGVVTLLVNAPLTVGQNIVTAGLGHGLDGSHIIYALPQYLVTGVDEYGQIVVNQNIAIPNQVVFADSGVDIAREPVTGGTLATGVCTWIDDNDVADWLGIEVATSAETDFLEICAQSSNDFCYRRRREAGYVDPLATPPSEDVKLGCVMYAGALYRQRGAIDSFASFDGMSTAQIVGLAPIVKQLLGIDRPQVA
jgi:hypothetical protein